MGMKIDKVIQSLTAMKSVIGVNQLTINEAIETMQKYQKIEEIVNSKTTRLSYELGFRQIKKVIEDGKID